MQLDITKLKQIRSNYIIPPKPLGVLIQDSYNNISFPIKLIQIDTNKCNVGLIIDQFFRLYSPAARENNILPWHYIIEFYNENYIAHNTMPLNMKYVKTLEETKQDAVENNSPILNQETQKLLDSTVNIEPLINILLIGDSNQDVYTRKLYKCICNYVINPVSLEGKFVPNLYENIFFMNLGKNFFPDYLKQYMHV
jgi:hypothetical protein